MLAVLLWYMWFSWTDNLMQTVQLTHSIEHQTRSTDGLDKISLNNRMSSGGYNHHIDPDLLNRVTVQGFTQRQWSPRKTKFTVTVFKFKFIIDKCTKIWPGSRCKLFSKKIAVSSIGLAMQFSTVAIAMFFKVWGPKTISVSFSGG